MNGSVLGDKLMISAQIPMTLKASASNSNLSIDEFIEYTLKNDLNIVKQNCGSFYSYSINFRLQLNGSLIPEKFQFL